MPVNEPRKHHYIPQFYLRNWADSDGRVICYKRVPTGRLVHDQVAPKSTGYEEDLYTLDHLPAGIRQAIETYITADVDDRAAKSLQEMVKTKGVRTLTPEQRLSWSQFIVSLPIRNPEAVADIKETATKSGMEKACEEAKRKFPEWAQEDDFGTEFEEIVNEDPQTRFLSDNYGLLVITALMRNQQFHKPLLSMKWWVIDFSRSGLSLIVGDRPYVNFRPISHPRTLIYLPISPSLGFFASPEPEKERQLRNQDARFVAREMNRRQAAFAARYIYSADLQHKRLVEKHLRET